VVEDTPLLSQSPRDCRRRLRPEKGRLPPARALSKQHTGFNRRKSVHKCSSGRWLLLVPAQNRRGRSVDDSVTS